VGNGDVVEIITGTVTSRTKAWSAVNGGELLSVTRSVKFDVPTVVGVPLMTAPFRDSPAGKVPDTRDHV
jgi:hypothetical protein